MQNVKKSFVCRNVNDYHINTLLAQHHLPSAGDVAIFEVLNLGKHIRIQTDTEKNRSIFQGDHIMMAFGSRYATSQLHGLLPSETKEVYHILGQGGVCGIIENMNQQYEAVGPTELKLIGYAVNHNNEVINTIASKKSMSVFDAFRQSDSKLILSIGGSMDSGKTTTAAYLCRGLKRAGKKTAFIKLTGTAYTKDVDFVVDCGADLGLDFTQWGFPSTYLESEETLLNLFETLVHQASSIQPDYIIMEIADGLLQRETEILLNSALMQRVSGVIYSDSSSTGALSGIMMLEKLNITPMAICGSLLKSPLMVAEIQARTEIPVLGLNQLGAASIETFVQAGMPAEMEQNSVLATAI